MAASKPDKEAAKARAEELNAAFEAREAEAKENGENWDDEPDTATKPDTATTPATSAAATDEFNGTVKVRCIVDTQPWTHIKPLSRDEEATVPEDVAKTMLKRKQVELV